MTKVLLALTFTALLAACGDSASGSGPRTLSQVCDDMCGWPDACFVELGVPAPGSECMQSCEAQAEIVGVDCIGAISDTIACLGTCNLDSITQEQALACQEEAQAISNACE
ncbi:MAG: hypothetical protein PVH21_14330 [Myxococcales bacterium]